MVVDAAVDVVWLVVVLVVGVSVVVTEVVELELHVESYSSIGPVVGSSTHLIPSIEVEHCPTGVPSLHVSVVRVVVVVDAAVDVVWLVELVVVDELVMVEVVVELVIVVVVVLEPEQHVSSYSSMSIPIY